MIKKLIFSLSNIILIFNLHSMDGDFNLGVSSGDLDPLEDIRIYSSDDIKNYKKYINCYPKNLLEYINFINKLEQRGSKNIIDKLLPTDMLLIESPQNDSCTLSKVLASNLSRNLYLANYNELYKKYLDYTPNKISMILNTLQDYEESSVFFLRNLNSSEWKSERELRIFDSSIQELYKKLEEKNKKIFIMVGCLSGNLPKYLNYYQWSKIIRLKAPNNSKREAYCKNYFNDFSISIDTPALSLLCQKSCGMTQVELDNLFKVIAEKSISSDIDHITLDSLKNFLTDCDFVNLNSEEAIKFIKSYFIKKKYSIKDFNLNLVQEALNNLSQKDIIEILNKSINAKSNAPSFERFVIVLYSYDQKRENININSESVRTILINHIAKDLVPSFTGKDLKILLKQTLNFNISEIHNGITRYFLEKSLKFDQNNNQNIQEKHMDSPSNSNDINLEGLLMSSSSNEKIHQLYTQDQMGFDCGYHAFFNGISIENFIQEGYRLKNDKQNITQYDNYLQSLDLFKNSIVTSRIKNAIKYLIYDCLISCLKGSERVDTRELGSYSLHFGKGYIKLSPTENNGWFSWSKLVDEKVKIAQSILMPIAERLSESLKIYRTKGTYRIKRQNIIDTFLNYINLNDDINIKQRCEIVDSQDKLELAFSNINDIMIKTSAEGLSLLIEPIDKNPESLSNSIETIISIEDLSKEFLGVETNYFNGEMLDSKEILHLNKLNLAGSTLLEPKNIILCLGDGDDDFEDQLEGGKFKELLNKFNQRAECIATIILHIRQEGNEEIDGGHWIALVANKNASGIRFFIADSLNVNRINDERVNKVVTRISKVVQDNYTTNQSNDSVEEASIEKVYGVEDINYYMSQIKKPRKKLSDLGGLLDIKLRNWIDGIKCAIDLPDPENNPKSNLILHGVPGNGKTTLAEAIADELGADYIQVSISDLADKYKYSMSSKLRSLFYAVRKHKRAVVLCLDEIDGAVGERKFGNEDHSNIEGISELICQINNEDKTKISEGKTIIIGTTNRYSILPNTIKGRRFFGVEIKVPDTKKRRELIDFFINNPSTINNLGEKYLDNLAKKTKDWSICDIKEIMLIAKSSKFKEIDSSIKNKELKKNNVTSEIKSINKEHLEIGYNTVLEERNDSQNEKPLYISIKDNINENQAVYNLAILAAAGSFRLIKKAYDSEKVRKGAKNCYDNISSTGPALLNFVQTFIKK